MKRRIFPSFLIVFLVLTLTFIFVTSVTKVFADDFWDNTLTLYPNGTRKWDAIREIVNVETVELDVTVRYFSCSNISIIKSYVLYGNDTNFVTITNGIVTQSNDTIRLPPSGKVVFNVEAKPIDTLTGGETVSIVVTISRTPFQETGTVSMTTIPSLIQVILYPIAKPDVGVSNFFSRTTSSKATVNLKNLMQRNQNVTVNWYITEYNKETIIVNGTQNVLLGYPQNTSTTFYLPFTIPLDSNLIPKLDRTYTFHLEAVCGTMKTESLTTHFSLNTNALQLHLVLVAATIIFSIIIISVVYLRSKQPRED